MFLFCIDDLIFNNKDLYKRVGTRLFFPPYFSQPPRR